jgi:hypothetical protein
VRNSLIAKSIAFLLLYPISINSAFSQNIDNHLLSYQLEEVLNNQNDDLLKDLFLDKSLKKFNKQYLLFRKKYKDAQWSIRAIKNYQGITFLDVKITSTRKIGDQIYNLNSKQTVKIVTFQNKIKSYKIINEESILNSQKSPLIVKIISPNKVLTGEKYELNFIIEKPLDNSLIATGIIVLENNENIKISNDQFRIKPNQSGGLFKYIQAPLEPGFQTISAIITHPEGIYSITKKIKVGL